MKLPQPIRDKVLVRPFESDAITASGLEVPMSYRERNNKALVMAVGNGTKKEPMKYRNGMIVFNIKNCGDELLIGGEKHYLISQRDILAYEPASSMD